MELVELRANRFQEPPVGFLALPNWAGSMGGPISEDPDGTGVEFEFKSGVLI